jgi:hypothetical protein
VKHYQIVCRNTQWHLQIEGQDCGLLQSDERNALVQIACKVAAERGSAVQVFDQQNQLEARLSFQDGVLAVDGYYRGELDLCRDPQTQEFSFDCTPDVST